jgi:hypothetical protein
MAEPPSAAVTALSEQIVEAPELPRLDVTSGHSEDQELSNSIEESLTDAQRHIELNRKERGVDEDIPEEKRSRNFKDLRAGCEV